MSCVAENSHDSTPKGSAGNSDADHTANTKPTAGSDIDMTPTTTGIAFPPTPVKGIKKDIVETESSARG